MKEDLTIKRDVLMNLIAAISPMAWNYVDDYLEDTIVLYAETKEGSEGVFLRTATENLCVYYAHFPDDSSQELLDAIGKELNQINAKQGQCEICFNVHGKNKRIKALIQKRGFALDMAGYVFRYSSPTPSPVDLGGLTADGFIPSKCKDFVELFKSAYARLNSENGQDSKRDSEPAERLCHRFEALNENRAIQSFWHRGTLVGSYIVSGNYITDRVVHPRFQNKGYGTLMLKHCILFLRNQKGISDIHLRVAESNTEAKRLYERNGFLVISHFAEHTFQGRQTA